MLRRLLPTLVLLSLGLLVLGWGLWRLQRIFDAEARGARASLAARQETLSQYAVESLRHTLRQKWERAQTTLESARQDPLTPTEGLYLHERGEQVIPRLARWEPAAEGQVRRAYEALRAGSEKAAEPGGPWAERLTLLAQLGRALERRDVARTDHLFSQVLLHRGAFRVATLKDLPYMVVLLERLYERTEPFPDLMRGLLRDGVSDGQRGRVEGLQRQLLNQRTRLGPLDFAFLHERIARLSERAGAPYADFEARVRELGDAPLNLPGALSEPVVNGDWYLEPYADGSVRGVAIDLPSLVQDLTDEMRGRGLLGAEDEVVSPAANMPLSRLATLKLRVDSPQWAREGADIAQHYRLKTALLAGSALLGLGLFALLFLAQLRKWRFVELKSDFVAAVSHELRTPLASIRLMAETLERKLSGAPGAKDYPQRIVREADGLSFLVENLLSFHRIDKGRWVPRRSRVRLEELVGGLRTDLAHWSEKPVQLRASVGSVELDADAPLLRLLFSNLGRNACAYNTRSPVELAIETAPGGRVLFKDNGVGIAERDWERAFGEFQRLRGSGPEVHGSGLGLALCRRIMELHGGSMRIAQSSPEGTTFELTFPETTP